MSLRSVYANHTGLIVGAGIFVGLLGLMLLARQVYWAIIR